MGAGPLGGCWYAPGVHTGRRGRPGHCDSAAGPRAGQNWGTTSATSTQLAADLLFLPLLSRPALQSLAQGKLLLDPSSDEVFREEAGLLLAMMPTANEVLWVFGGGRVRQGGACGGWMEGIGE